MKPLGDFIKGRVVADILFGVDGCRLQIAVNGLFN